MPFIILQIPNKCPYCKKTIPSLRYFQMAGEVPYKFSGEFILTTSEKKLHFISAQGYCETCKQAYDADVGVSKSILTTVVKTYKNETIKSEEAENHSGQK